jgi:acetyl-CoA carboxylase biotin carboxyl carrier protein
MTYKEIQDLLKFISKSEIAEVKIKEGEFELIVRNKNYTKKALSTPTPIVSTPVVQSIPAAAPAEIPAAAPEAKPAAPAPKIEEAASAPESTEGLLEVKSPIVGTFYRSSSPDKPAYVSVGDTIAQGDVVCIVEAMKLFNEIESEVAGKVVKVLVDDASPVEYDQVLFLVDPKG